MDTTRDLRVGQCTAGLAAGRAAFAAARLRACSAGAACAVRSTPRLQSLPRTRLSSLPPCWRLTAPAGRGRWRPPSRGPPHQSRSPQTCLRGTERGVEGACSEVCLFSLYTCPLEQQQRRAMRCGQWVAQGTSAASSGNSLPPPRLPPAPHQSGRSCRCGRSWRCQRPPAAGWIPAPAGGV